MNSFRRQLNNQITNQNEERGTSLFNKVSGIAIVISILLAVLETETHIEIHFGELIHSYWDLSALQEWPWFFGEITKTHSSSVFVSKVR